jgi:hypothetical protein
VAVQGQQLLMDITSTKILQETGIKYSGNAPPKPAYAVKQDKKYPLSMPPNIISCNYKDVLTGRVHVFDLTNLC